MTIQEGNEYRITVTNFALLILCIAHQLPYQINYIHPDAPPEVSSDSLPIELNIATGNYCLEYLLKTNEWADLTDFLREMLHGGALLSPLADTQELLDVYTLFQASR